MENNITLEEIEKAVVEYYTKQPTTERKIRLICWQGGYDLFQKALQEEFKKQYKPNLNDSKNKKTAPKRSSAS